MGAERRSDADLSSHAAAPSALDVPDSAGSLHLASDENRGREVCVANLEEQFIQAHDLLLKNLWPWLMRQRRLLHGDGAVEGRGLGVVAR